jgi:hypothetical protein
VPYHVNIVLEPVDNSVAGVGEAICSQAADLQAAAVSGGFAVAACEWCAYRTPHVQQATCQLNAAEVLVQVVMGSHMRGGVLQFILGSISQYVAHRCTRPVAVLH